MAHCSPSQFPSEKQTNPSHSHKKVDSQCSGSWPSHSFVTKVIPFVKSDFLTFILLLCASRNDAQSFQSPGNFFFIVVQVQLSPFPPSLPTPPQPSHPHFPPLILPLFGFAHGSFIHIPDNTSPFPAHYPLPLPLWLLSGCS